MSHAEPYDEIYRLLNIVWLRDKGQLTLEQAKLRLAQISDAKSLEAVVALEHLSELTGTDDEP